MWDKPGFLKVLFQIEWNHHYAHYFLDAGAYDHEEEVLLMDGVCLRVQSIQ